MKSTVLFTFILFMSAFLSYGQAQEMGKRSIESLHFLKGNWSVINFEWNNDMWRPLGSTSAEINLEHDGKFIYEKVRYLLSSGAINMITNIAYDDRLKKLKLCAMDKEYGYMDIYHGSWINDQLIFTNITSDIPIKLDDGRELSFRLTYADISNQSFSHMVEGTYDKGRTWFKFSKGIYKKQKK